MARLLTLVRRLWPPFTSVCGSEPMGPWPGSSGGDAARPPGHVMKCHVLSCDVMFRRRPAPLRPPHRSAARLHPAYRSSIAFRSVRAAAGLPAARPFFARIACARARVRAGAVRAPDCACAHVGQPQGARLSFVSQGFLRAGAKQEAKRPRGRRCLPPVSYYHKFPGVKFN